MQSQQMKEKIREYIARNFLAPGAAFSDQDPLFSRGRIDSLGHLKLISFLEKEFQVSLSIDDLSWENFDTVDSIQALVKKRLGR